MVVFSQGLCSQTIHPIPASKGSSCLLRMSLSLGVHEVRLYTDERRLMCCTSENLVKHMFIQGSQMNHRMWRYCEHRNNCHQDTKSRDRALEYEISNKRIHPSLLWRQRKSAIKSTALYEFLTLSFTDSTNVIQHQQSVILHNCLFKKILQHFTNDNCRFP